MEAQERNSYEDQNGLTQTQLLEDMLVDCSSGRCVCVRSICARKAQNALRDIEFDAAFDFQSHLREIKCLQRGSDRLHNVRVLRGKSASF